MWCAPGSAVIYNLYSAIHPISHFNLILINIFIQSIHYINLFISLFTISIYSSIYSLYQSIHQLVLPFFFLFPIQTFSSFFLSSHLLPFPHPHIFILFPILTSSFIFPILTSSFIFSQTHNFPAAPFALNHLKLLSILFPFYFQKFPLPPPPLA